MSTFSSRLQMLYSEVLDDKGNDYLDRMQKATDRMRCFLEDLIRFSRVTLKARPFESIDLQKVVSEVVSDLEHRIKQTGGRVEVEFLPEIDADRFF